MASKDPTPTPERMAAMRERAKEVKAESRAAKTHASRKLRIVLDHPLLGICEYCNMQFHSSLLPVEAAKDDIQERFNVHKCKHEDVNQAAARIVREATERH